ncbi:methyltransferase domain-containing protein [Halomonas sp. I1]|uniref:class I SAM-dependent methyltransferase n=1 Tax=Halomonas sp. I1 TaxID=393536 RepID=UPI0028DDE812|nr:methyltransferase domain-containing protein [Halomonas sp. I1]MDT8894667.1 methyltransferase domain-containing protein [Halomonas sp. I1]
MTNGGRGGESCNGWGQAGPSRDAERLARHYAGADGAEGGNRDTLVGRLRRAFVASGRNPDRLSLDDIAGIDQLHLGGRRASRSLARLGALSPGDRVLDVGCGTGGASRLLAEEHGVEVVGIDITAAFIEVAGWLSRATGLSSRTRFSCADAARTPLPDACAEVIWCQHALMNMPDVEAVLAEWRRLLAPGGRVLLHEVVAGDNPAALTLPVPWARERATSHLQTRRCLEQRLETAGFQPVDVTDVTAEALAWRRKHGRQASGHQSSAALPGPADLFGDIFSEMGRNLLDNLADDRVRIIEGAWVTT